MAMRNINHRTMAMRLRGGDCGLEGGCVVGFTAFRAEIAFNVENLAWHDSRVRFVSTDACNNFRFKEGSLRRKTAGRIMTLAAEIKNLFSVFETVCEVIISHNKLEIMIQCIASYQLFSLRMMEGDGGSICIIGGRFDGTIKNQRRHDILQDSAVWRCETADMAVLHDGGAMRILLQEEMRAAIGRATADGGRVFAERTKISDFATLEMTIYSLPNRL